MDEQRLERALRAGPPFATRYVARQVELTDGPLLRGGVRAGVPATRGLLLVALVAMLLVAALAGLAIGAFLRSSPGVVAYNGLLPDDTYHIFVLTEDGRERDLFSQPRGSNGLDNDPWVIDWSPDRRLVTFLAYEGEGDASDSTDQWVDDVVLYVADLDANASREVLRLPWTDYSSPWSEVAGCGWAPDGSAYAVCTYDGLILVDIERGSSVRVPFGGFPGRVNTPRLVEWSPDASWLLYLTDEGGGVVRSDGSARHQLGADGDAVRRASWSPDGSSIAFTTLRGTGFPGSAWVIRPDGSDLRNLATVHGSWSPSPALNEVVWAPDAHAVALQEFSGPDTVDLVDMQGSATTIDLGLDPGANLISLLGWSDQAGIVARALDPQGYSVVTAAVDRDGSRVIGHVGDAVDNVIWLDADGLNAAWQTTDSRTVGCIVRLHLTSATTEQLCVPVVDRDQDIFRGGQYVWAHPD
jgi:dipeptidyl aminopeptidase/acylaminoacyl peptidase